VPFEQLQGMMKEELRKNKRKRKSRKEIKKDM